ncbi:hypothetical protein SAMN05660199_01002 [Klenkia soli]|uniref:Uncharacterized protein n=1 Tax=Klenkia soli TaxID=1052260 RepID=A0A1H0FRW5_9ACTN|nr:hypothetical protein [Klenkia soli]SDN97380.1 hypothetical protein SAMN05660199_01002 [Klenkia soli]
MTSDERAVRGLDVRAPDGELLERGRRLTFRDARPWVRRQSALVGVWNCGTPVAWAVGDARRALVDRIRASEGGDCNIGGDVLLFRLADGRRAVVVDRT